ncbi:MAG: MFS transporter [Myxococcota bacterium]
MVADSEARTAPEGPSAEGPALDAKGRRTEPDHNETGWPKGVPYIIGNEGCERFSYYGMRAILTVYMAFLFKETGMAEGEAGGAATAVYHYFVAAAYFFPVLGAIMADRLFGKYNTILWLSIIYTIGHGVLSIGEGSLPITYAGLILIAIGTGGIKPCVSANVGDQFGRGNRHLLGKMYQAFYFIINFGSLFSQILIPWLKNEFGWSVAFGVPGILMAIATVFFWMGRNKFVHVPATPGGKLGALDMAIGTCLFVALGGPLFVNTIGLQVTLASCIVALAILPFVYRARQRIQQDDGFFAVLFTTLNGVLTGKNDEAKQAGFGQKVPGFFAAAEQKLGFEAVEAHIALWRIMSIFIFVAMFWALFDQHGSTWVLQAEQMDLVVGSLNLDASQIQSLNPAMVMILIPVNLFLFWALEAKLGIKVTMLRRMTTGMLMTGFAFVAAATVQEMVDGAPAQSVSVLWQVPQYFIMTQAEVLVSITGLEFAYTQAPKRVKSTVMSLWLLTVTVGNVLVSLMASGGHGEAFELAPFFWFFAFAMLGFGALFALRAWFYTEREYAA